MGRYEGVTYSAEDTIHNLSRGQLELMVNSQHDWLLGHLEEHTAADVHRIRLLLELGQIEARRRLETS